MSTKTKKKISDDQLLQQLRTVAVGLDKVERFLAGISKGPQWAGPSQLDILCSYIDEIEEQRKNHENP